MDRHGLDLAKLNRNGASLARRISLIGSLSYRPFALLWSGQTVSRLGDSLYRIALVWWVLQKTGSATVMGTVLIVSFIPLLLFLLFGGVAVDRVPRLWVMLSSDLLRGAVVVGVALLAYFQTLAIWHIYIVSILFGFLDAFFEPAYAAAVPELAPQHVLPSANSLTVLSRQITGVVGPALGAALVGLGGSPAAFALDGVSFFISAACLMPLAGSAKRQVSSPRPSSLFDDLRQGLQAVLGNSWLWITIALAALGNITLSAPFAVALPFLVKNTLRADVSALGLLYAASALGSALTAVWLGQSRKLHRRGLIAYSALLMGSLTTLAVGLSTSLSALALALLLNGAVMTIFGLIWTYTLQELVPKDLLGRVSSIDLLGSFALIPVGFGVVGWATDQIGAPLVFMTGGLLTAALIALALAQPAIRHLD